MPYIQDTRSCFAESIGPNGLEAVEFATLIWIDSFDNQRLFDPTGNIPPPEYDQE